MDKSENIFTSTEDKQLKEWSQYIQNLFNDDRTASHNINLNDGIDITKAEVEHATPVAKSGKSPGPDGIYVDVLEVFNENTR
ncbi:hypothetical protein HHI36_017321 [Cryptolaemus montrouzieri]|uniref:PH domain-containing protein n=1 Tax=Cryptolaemus montrouzieri TaxID=559131 RepID=A0ABD2NM80_9CUCU